MKEGDLVRFAIWGEFDHTIDWDKAEKNHIGTLVEHDKLMQIAVVFYKGELHRVRSQLVEKAGRRDVEGR